MTQVLTGGCQCGAVRYEANGDPVFVALCHCSMCRRANAAPAVGWAMYTEQQVQFVQGTLTHYDSSVSARRGFCGSCGTQLTWTGEAAPGLIDLTIGSFDRPEVLEPSLHYWDSKRLPWLKFADGLPRHAQLPPFE
jgi:hypothetical protein